MKFASKIKAAAATVCTAALALSGCGAVSGNAAESMTASGEDVTISIFWWGSDARIKKTQEVIKAFEAKHPTITVEATYADWSGYRDKLATMVAGGNAPDVMQMDELFLASYASQGSLLDLSAASKFLNLDSMARSVRDMGKYDGVQYAAPTGTAPLGVAVNMDILESLGLSLPDNTDTWTWNDFEQFELEIVKRSNGEIIGAGTLPSGDGLSLWSCQHGADLFADGRVSISQDALSAWLDKTREYTQNGILGTADRWAEDLTATTEQCEFGTGRQAMKFMTATQTTQYAKALGTENLVMVPLPSNSTSRYMYMKPNMYWSVASTSQHPAEAAMLIDYFINDADAVGTQGTDRGIPSNNKIRESMGAAASGLDKLAFEYTDKMTAELADNAPSITPNGGSDVQNIGKRYQQDVVFGKQSAQDAAKAMIIEIQNAIDVA